MKLKRVATALLVGFGLVLAAPAQARDELVIGISQFPTGFHPNTNSHVALSLIMGMTRRPFTAYNADWELVCLLCTELPSREQGTARFTEAADGTPTIAVDYAIQPEATWGDGTPITTEDVMFTWEIGRIPESGVGNLEMYRTMERIEVHDDKRFTIHLDRRECGFEGIGDFRPVPAHLERDAFADPAEYANRSLYETDTTNPGLYFGPYRVTRVDPGALVVLERNPTWWGKAPEFDRITFKIFENTSALEANLLSGNIDYIAGEAGISLDQALGFEKRHADKYKIVYRAGLLYEHIDMRLDNPILSDRRVRRALLLATDREAISQRLFEGKQPVAHTNIHPSDAVFFEGVPKYEFSPEQAVELLEEAGWTDIRDGIRHNAAGDRLTLEIMTTSGNRIRELVQQVLQSMWRDVGIDLRIRNEPPRVLFGQTLRERRFPDMAMFAWLSVPENIPRTALHSDQVPTEANGFSGQNYTGYSNPMMDETLEALRVQCGEEEQTELWNRVQTMYAEDLPVLPLYFRSNPYIMPKWLDGVTPTGHLNPSSLWVENWTVAE